MRCTSYQLAVELKERAEESLAQPHGVSDDRVEDRLDVGRGTADDAQDLGGRRLLLEGLGDLRMRLGERPILLLEFGEQADVLDGDHRLISERLQQLDLSFREASRLRAAQGDGADGSALPDQGNGERGAEAEAPRRLAALGEFGRFFLEIGDVDRPRLQH
ncbi:MAG TPA: hypothetical protein VNP53_07495 [Methylomirabilota bacterium]|nr:hypothetical protein [Methylomirabilota bacterium]